MLTVRKKFFVSIILVIILLTNSSEALSAAASAAASVIGLPARPVPMGASGLLVETAGEGGTAAAMLFLFKCGGLCVVNKNTSFDMINNYNKTLSSGKIFG